MPLLRAVQGRLELDESTLQALLQIDGNLSIVSLVGSRAAGCASLLNDVLSLDQQNCFRASAAHSATPKTNLLTAN